MPVEQSPFGHSVPHDANLCKEFEGCSVPVDCKYENQNIEGRNDSYGRHEECRMPPVSQADQLSTGSPPPFGDGKVSDDSSDEYRGHVRFDVLPISSSSLLFIFSFRCFCCKYMN